MAVRVDLSGLAFSHVDGTGYEGSFISYLDAAKNHFESTKKASHSLLALQPNDKVIDVGCGTGDDIREIAALIGPHGMAVGVDRSESMIKEARRRSSGQNIPVQFEVSEAEKLPWDSNYFEACHADRLLQHVLNPVRVLRELLRVLKPSGRLVIVDRDWGMVAVDSPNTRVTRIVLDSAAANIRNGWMGRKLYGLFKRIGVEDVRVQTHCIPVRSFESADSLLDLRTVAEHAITGGELTYHDVEAWLEDLLQRDHCGEFFATITLFVVSGRKH